LLEIRGLSLLIPVHFLPIELETQSIRSCRTFCRLPNRHPSSKCRRPRIAEHCPIDQQAPPGTGLLPRLKTRARAPPQT
jgi:hypothetical protein